MSKEQIIDEAYENYREKNHILYKDTAWTKEEFINKIKTDTEFSEKWGLKIEERELSGPERYMMFEDRGYEFRMNSWSQEEQFDKSGIPTKLITLKYNDETLESYE